MQPRTLDEWLVWQQKVHPEEIDLGLDRISVVWQNLHPDPFEPVLVTVGGTNGKGSCVAYLEAISVAASWRVGTYTSPHLVRYNERVRIDGEDIDDASLCAAFERIERARGDVPLTYFEYGTLAALDIFSRKGLDIVVLEVGLGGRLDASNLLDADAALITSIGLDHQQWLGDTLDSIGREKAGILRSGKPAIYAEPNPPQGFIDAATDAGADICYCGRDYSYRQEGDGWSWQFGDAVRSGLPLPRLRGSHQMQNAAAVIAILHLMREMLPVSVQAVKSGLQSVSLAGRFQVVPGEPVRIFDVAHNREAAEALAANLAAMPPFTRLNAVFAMYRDKPLEDVVALLEPHVDAWNIFPIPAPRGMSVAELHSRMNEAGVKGEIVEHENIDDALLRASTGLGERDAVLVFGSFEVVGAALSKLE